MINKRVKMSQRRKRQIKMIKVIKVIVSKKRLKFLLKLFYSQLYQKKTK